MINKEPIRSTYKCSQCQKNFTILDWKQQNYQLFFKETGVIVELQHLLCPLTGSWNYQKDIIGND